MGKKKQKVRWTAVEENFFNEDSGSGSDCANRGVSNGDAKFIEYGPYPAAQQQNKPFPPRRYGPHWSSAPLAPRFERKAAAEAAKAAAAAHNGSCGGMTVYYDGECCETEQLPDGFTKIRSKNLDVLFKRDYYSHKIELSRSNCSSEPGDDDLGSDDEEEEGDEEESEFANEGDDTETTVEMETVETKENGEVYEKEKEVDTSNKKDVGEESDKSLELSTYPYSPNAPPFVPSSQSRPNLFLYSPASNTMIPCEEIIIPNPVLGPDGPMYQGPSNIYLAFPMENSPTGGNTISPTDGYIAQQQSFIPPNQVLPGAVQFDQYGVPYQPYQPLQPPQTITVEHTGVTETITTVYQSTSSEGGTEPSSADSTTPHSPPDLSAYSPSNWANAHFDHGIVSPPNGSNYRHVNNAPSWYNNNTCNSNTRNLIKVEEEKLNSKLSDQNGLPCQDDVSRSRTAVSQSMKTHIPGLNPDLLHGTNSSKGKRVQKKKRRKKVMPSSPQKVATDCGGKEEEEVYYPKENTEMKVTKILSRSSSVDADHVSRDQPTPILSTMTEVKADSASPECHKSVLEEEEEVISCSLHPTSSNSSESSFNTSSIPSSEFDEDKTKKASIPEEPSPNTIIAEDLANNNDVAIVKDEYLSRAVTTTAKCDDINTETQLGEKQECDLSTVKVEELVPEEALPEQDPNGAPDLDAKCNKTTNAYNDNSQGKEEEEMPQNEEKEEEIAQQHPKSPRKTVPDVSRKNRKKLNKRDAKNQHPKSHTNEEAFDKIEASQNSPTETIKAKKEDKTLYCNVVRQTLDNHEPAFDTASSLVEEVKEKKKIQQDGEWETKKRRSRRGNNKKFVQKNAIPAQEEEEVLVVQEEIELVKEVLSEKENVIAVIDIDKKEEDTEEVSTPTLETPDAESTQQETKRSTTRKSKKKRYASYESSDVKTSTHQVLIQDGFIDFSQGPQRRSSSYEPSDSKKDHLDTLFISSIGHGIQQGPLFMGRLGQGKYSPPDRSEEIPLKYRENEEEEKGEEEEGSENKEEVEITETVTEEDLALD